MEACQMILPKQRTGLKANSHRVIVRGLLNRGAGLLGDRPQLGQTLKGLDADAGLGVVLGGIG
jgi:hypothetical protein